MPISPTRPLSYPPYCSLPWLAALLLLALLLTSCGGGGGGGNAPTSATNITEVFVSPSGTDSNPGTLAQPFKTLEAARSAVRGQIVRGLPSGGVTVWLRDGLYERSATLELGAQDSGSASSPVTWRAYAGETPRLVGAKKLDPSWFAPVTSSSAVWSRLDTAAKGNVVQLDLRARGISEFGTLLPNTFGSIQSASMALLINGKAQSLARWPDTDDTSASPSQGFVQISTVPSPTSFTLPSNRLSRWTSATDIWVDGYFGQSWAQYQLPVQSLTPNQQKVTLSTAPGHAMKANQSLYFYNLLEEITKPGEWYLNRTTGILYFWTVDNFVASEILITSLNTPIIKFNGANNITFNNIIVEASQSSLLAYQGGVNNKFINLKLGNGGLGLMEISSDAINSTANFLTTPGEPTVNISGDIN